MLTTEKIVVRSSSLPSYADCPRRTAGKLLAKELAALGIELRQTAQGIGAALGSSTHEAAAYSLNSKINDGSLGNATQAMDNRIEGDN